MIKVRQLHPRRNVVGAFLLPDTWTNNPDGLWTETDARTAGDRLCGACRGGFSSLPAGSGAGQELVGGAVEGLAGGGEAGPEEAVAWADLAQVVARDPPVVPDLPAAVEDPAGGQLQRRDGAAAQDRPGGPGELGQPLPDGPQEQEAGAPGQEHGAVAPAPPQLLQTHIGTAAQGEEGAQSRVFVHKITSEKVSPKFP